MDVKRLYIVVRRDLPTGLQLAQACHATREFTLAHPNADVGENLVVLHAPGAQELAELAARARALSLTTTFHEPDLGGALTAAAFDGRVRRLLSQLPCAFSRRALARSLDRVA